MTSTLDFIKNKFSLDINQKLPIVIPNFGRDQLAELLHELDFKKGVEVGVAAGEYSEVLAKANPGMQLWGVDPFTRQPDYKDYTRDSTFNRLLTDAESRLNKFDHYKFIQATSLEAVAEFENDELDFAYIDANHDFRHVTEDVDSWLKKIRKGGIIAGHDYCYARSNPRQHVKYAIPAYMSAWKLSPWFVLGNDSTREGLIRDMPRSWMYIK